MASFIRRLERNGIAWRHQAFFIVDGARLKIPASLDTGFAPHQTVKRDKKSHHHLMVMVLFSVFEQPFDNRLVTGTIQWAGQIGEDLLAGPGPRILFPAVGKSGQAFLLVYLAKRFEEKIIFVVEVFFDQQHLTALISRSSHVV